MANPTVLIEIKTIGADKAVTSVKKITLEVNKSEKATKRLRETTKSAGELAVDAARKAAAEEKKRGRQIEASRLQMKQFQASLKQKGAPFGFGGPVSGAFKKLERTLRQQGLSAQGATKAINEYQTVLIKGKGRLLDWRQEQLRAAAATDKMGNSLRMTIPQMNKVVATSSKTAKGIRKVGEAANKSKKETKGFGDGLKNLSSSAVIAVGPLSGVGARIVAMGAIPARGGLKVAFFLTTLTALFVLAAKAIKAFAGMEKQLLRLEAVLIATGNASGATAEQIDRMAVAFGKATLNSIEAGRQIFTIFASF